jgi:hypothetical protein
MNAKYLRVDGVKYFNNEITAGLEKVKELLDGIESYEIDAMGFGVEIDEKVFRIEILENYGAGAGGHRGWLVSHRNKEYMVNCVERPDDYYDYVLYLGAPEWIKTDAILCSEEVLNSLKMITGGEGTITFFIQTLSSVFKRLQKKGKN